MRRYSSYIFHSLATDMKLAWKSMKRLEEYFKRQFLDLPNSAQDYPTWEDIKTGEFKGYHPLFTTVAQQYGVAVAKIWGKHLISSYVINESCIFGYTGGQAYAPSGKGRGRATITMSHFPSDDYWRVEVMTHLSDPNRVKENFKIDCSPEEATIRNCCSPELITAWKEAAIATGYAEDEVPLDFPLLLPENWLDIWEIKEITKLQLLCE